MPVSTNEATLIRYKTGDDESTLSQEILNLLLDEAAVNYAGYSRKVWLQVVLVGRYRNLLASYRKDVTYKQNETSENLSDVAKGYAQDLAREEKILEDMLSDEGVSAYIVATRKVPSSSRELP